MSKPDWNFWLPRPWVKAWEAVALSLDLEPRSLEQDPLSILADTGGGPFFLKQNFPDRQVKDEFDKRLRLLIAHYRNRDYTGFDDANLAEFSAWSQSAHWPVPPEISALAKHAGGEAKPDC